MYMNFTVSTKMLRFLNFLFKFCELLHMKLLFISHFLPESVCGTQIPSLIEGGWVGNTVVVAVGIVGMTFRPARSSKRHNRSSSFSPVLWLFSFSNPTKNNPWEHRAEWTFNGLIGMNVGILPTSILFSIWPPGREHLQLKKVNSVEMKNR